MSQVLDTILEYTLGSPGSIIDSPEVKADAQAAADRAIERIAENRSNRSGLSLIHISEPTRPY